MKVFDKLKNMFTEEVEVEEEPIKKEVIQVEIPAPEPRREMKRETKTEPVEEEKGEAKEEKFVFPVYFDDKDFDDLEKTEKKPEKKETLKKEPYGAKQVVKEERKIFKPTPIISPVYGVLDKNYRKEDIVSKPNAIPTYHDSVMTIDDIRKKAYGTLEDDLENTLFNVPKHESKEEEKDMFEELEEPMIDIFDGDMTSFDLLSQDTDKRIRHEEVEDDNLVSEELNRKAESEDTLTESDLFDLMDSIYEKGDES